MWNNAAQATNRHLPSNECYIKQSSLPPLHPQHIKMHPNSPASNYKFLSTLKSVKISHNVIKIKLFKLQMWHEACIMQFNVNILLPEEPLNLFK